MQPPSPTSSFRVKRESSVVSSFSTSSRSRRSEGGNFLPPPIGRGRVPFTPDLENTPTQLPDVTGRSDLANYSTAEYLKNLLDTDDSLPPPPSSPSDQTSSEPSRPSALPRISSGAASSLLSEAFRREYSTSANDERKRAYSTMYTEEEEDRASRSVRAPSYAGSTVAQSDSGGRKKFRSDSQQPGQALILPGLGDGRTRNVNDKSLYGGQDVGVGVIGSQAYLETCEEEAALQQECDIPMPEAACDWSVRQIEGEEEGTRFMVGPHIVSLEEDLPPLATEHPARVWNSVLHSLPQELVPTVQWKYEKVMAGDDEDDEPMHICQLTLSLSPDHPAIKSHPSFSKLPTNRHTAEYITAAAAIGGSKTWTGEAKPVKSEATNSALLECISSGAFKWLHSSALEEPVTGSVPREATAARPSFSSTPPGHLNEMLMGDPATSPSPSGEAGGAEDRIGPVQRGEGQPEMGPKSGGSPANGSSVLVEPTHPPAPGIGRIKAAISDMLAALPTSVKPVFSLTVEWDAYANTFVERLHTGADSVTQRYSANSDVDSPTFGAAVLKAATAGGLEAFLKHFDKMHRALTGQQRLSDCAVYNGADPIEVPAMDPAIGEDTLVDWVEQIKAFCRSNGLRYPVYSQDVEKVSGAIQFRSSMKLEEDYFRANSTYGTILQARQEIARWVFSQHFGQKASVIEHDFQHDGGFKGGRGGRGGKRGRGRW